MLTVRKLDKVISKYVAAKSTEWSIQTTDISAISIKLFRITH